MTFRQLHEQDEPLLLCNVWNVASAKIATQEGFQAIGTTSAAIASTLGFEDGEKVPFSGLVKLVNRIKAHTSLPLTVDVEAGYGSSPQAIVQNIKTLAAAGIAGINIEDSIVKGKRVLCHSTTFALTLETIKEALLKEGTDLFLNVRTDTYLVGLSDILPETIKRAQLYEAAGADGIFVPCMVKETAIKTVIDCTNLPLNVMCMPQLPAFDRLKTLGVKRISMGNFLFEHMYSQFAQTLRGIKTQGNFNVVFQPCS